MCNDCTLLWERFIIIENAIRCKKCGDIVESASVHDFKTRSADGGHDYLRRSAPSVANSIGVVGCDMIQRKGEIERYVRLTLGAVCNYPIEYLACVDKPDLQDAIHSYGIEVVEDCYPNEKKALRFVLGIWQKQMSKIKAEQLERLKRLGGSITEENGVVARADFGTTSANPAHLIDTIKGKVEKLNNGEYKAFASYGLYVIVDTTFPFDSYVQSVVESIAEFQTDKEFFYKTIYLAWNREICICDMIKKAYTKKIISPEMHDAIYGKG